MEPERVLELLRHDVLLGARALLGTDLVCGELRARIVETEAYRTPDDPASHAHRGPTPRNAVMYGPSGHAYIYFNYGVHWMLNVTAHAEGDAAAVLVRAAQPLAGLEMMRERRPKARRNEDLLSGPGKLAAGFGLSKEQHGAYLFDPGGFLRIEAGQEPKEVIETTRVGINVGREHPWRFIHAELRRWASAPIPK